MGARPDDNHDEQQQHNIDIPQERITDGNEEEVAVSGGDHEQEIDRDRANAAKTIQDAYRRHLEQKRVVAARKIQVAYRRRLGRRGIVRKGIDATQAHYWHLLRKKSREVKWPMGSQYYLLFRVPLAYILVCLNTIKAFVESEKKEAKKRLLTEDDKNLERLIKVLDQHRCDSVNLASF